VDGIALMPHPGNVDVRFITEGSIKEYEAEMLVDLMPRTDGFVWVDVPEWNPLYETVLEELIGLHPMVLKACRERNHVPTIHGYADHVFVVLHSPLAGDAGHVHMLELDLVIGPRLLVTVHGPINPILPIASALMETQGVLKRIEGERFRPRSPGELAYAVVSAVARRQRAAVGEVAERIPGLEKRVMEGDFRNAEALLEEMFLLRHELMTVRTMAAQEHEIFARMSNLGERIVSTDDVPYAHDLADQFDRVRSIADGECQFLFGVIELYQTRVTTKMTLAMERLAVIAAVTLPVTAIASVYGMNVIVNNDTHWTQLVIVVCVMILISGLLLRWAHKQGWW
jgi:magnesium transporter